MNSYSVNVNDAAFSSLNDLWFSTVNYVPQIFGALFVLIVGLLIASILGDVVRRLVHLLKLNQLSERTGINKLFEHAGIKFSATGLFAGFAQWFVALAVFMAAAEILGWRQVTIFLNDIALYIPKVFVAIIILGIGIIAGHFVYEVITKSGKATNKLTEEQACLLGGIAKWSIFVFSVLVALTELGIATRLIEILFTGIVLALALAFGLGGKEKAARLLERLEKAV